MEFLLTAERRQLNRIAFDTATTKLRKQNDIIGRIKNEINGIKERFQSMCTFLSTTGNDVTQMYKDLYDAHITAFLHAVSLYLIDTDNVGARFIPEVTDSVKTTDMTLQINFQYRTITEIITTIDNVTIDFQNIDIYIGDLELNCLSAEQLEAQFATTIEYPQTYFSKNEFMIGISYELEKLELFHSRICIMEQKIIGAIRYVAELKTFGLY